MKKHEKIGEIANLYAKLQNKKITLKQFATEVAEMVYPGNTINDLELPSEWWEGPGC